MSPAPDGFFLSPLAGLREGKRGRAPLTAEPAPTRSLVSGPEVATGHSPLEVMPGCAKVVGNPEPGDQDHLDGCR